MALAYRPVSLAQITALKALSQSVAQFRADARAVADDAAVKLTQRFGTQWAVRGYTYNGALQWFVAPEWALAQIDAGGTPSSGGSAGGSGGGAGGTMSAGAGAAAAAVQAGMPAFTGGGPSFSIGAANVRALLAERADAFMGVDTLTPEQRLDAGYSPDSINWDGFTKIGSRCVRRGSAKMLEDRDNVTIGGSPISADYRGLSIATVLRGGAYGDAMLLAFADNEIGQTRTAQVTTLHLVQNYILWGRPTTLKGWAGPKMALSQVAGPKVRVTTDYTSVFSAATAGMRNNSVIGLVVRYSGPTATESYPLDIDGYDHMENTTTASTALVNRASWLGASRVDDTAVLAVGKYWFTAWAISREGYSEPSFASLTVT